MMKKLERLKAKVIKNLDILCGTVILRRMKCGRKTALATTAKSMSATI